MCELLIPARGFYPLAAGIALANWPICRQLDLRARPDRCGNGDGTFSAAPSSASDDNYINSIAVGDFNGDGIPDLAIVPEGNDDGTASQLSILLGNGDGSFRAAASPPGEYAPQVAVSRDRGDAQKQPMNDKLYGLRNTGAVRVGGNDKGRSIPPYDPCSVVKVSAKRLELAGPSAWHSTGLPGSVIPVTAPIHCYRSRQYENAVP